MSNYSIVSLIRNAFSHHEHWGRAWRDPAPKPTYDVAILDGVRLGSPAATTRGFGVVEFEQIGHWITEALDGLAASNTGDNSAVEAAVRRKVGALCERFPIYRTAAEPALA